MGLGSTFSEANIRNQGCGGHGTRARLSGWLARIMRIIWGLQHEPVGFGKSAFERWREDNEVAYQCCMSHPKSAVSLNAYQLAFSASCTTKQHETTSRPGLVRVNFALHAFAVFDIGASGHESRFARWLAISIHPHSGWDLMRCIQSYQSLGCRAPKKITEKNVLAAVEIGQQSSPSASPILVFGSWWNINMM